MATLDVSKLLMLCVCICNCATEPSLFQSPFWLVTLQYAKVVGETEDFDTICQLGDYWVYHALCHVLITLSSGWYLVPFYDFPQKRLFTQRRHLPLNNEERSMELEFVYLAVTV